MKKRTFKDFLTHKTTLWVSGIIAVIVLGAVFVTRALVETYPIIEVKSMTNIVATLDQPVKAVVQPDGIVVIDAKGTYIPTDTKVTTDGKLDIMTKAVMTEWATYELLLKGGVVEPTNIDLKKAFVAKVVTNDICKTITLWKTVNTYEYATPVGTVYFFSDMEKSYFYSNPEKRDIVLTRDMNKEYNAQAYLQDMTTAKTLYIMNTTTKATAKLTDIAQSELKSEVTFTDPATCTTPPTEKCTITNTLDKATPKYTTSLGNIIYDGASKMTSDNVNLYFSLDDKTYEPVFDLNRAVAPQTLYLQDMKTRTKISYTNFVYDAKALTVNFDITRPLYTDVLLSREQGLAYTFAEKEALIYDGGAYIRGEGIEISVDGGKTRIGEYKAETYPTTLLVRSKLTQTTTELTKVVLDPKLGTLSFSIANPCIIDTDKDGVEDKNDDCPKLYGKKEFNGCTALLRVSVEENVNGTHQDTALETKVFDAAAGSCVATVGAQPQNYAAIREKCAAELTKKETMSPVEGNKPRNLISDLAGLGVTKGTKLVLVKSQASVDGSFGYMGFDLPTINEGETRDVGFNIVAGQTLNFVQTSIFTKDSKGFRQSLRRAQVIKGSELQIFQPDFSLRNGTEEVYPFMFVSDGDWDVDICLEVPAGYKIAEPGKCSQTFLSNETKIVEFVAVETGSPKSFDVGASLKVKHKGKITNVNLKIKSHNPNAKDK